MTLSFVLINHSKGGAKDLILAQTGWYSSLKGNERFCWWSWSVLMGWRHVLLLIWRSQCGSLSADKTHLKKIYTHSCTARWSFGFSALYSEPQSKSETLEARWAEQHQGWKHSQAGGGGRMQAGRREVNTAHVHASLHLYMHAYCTQHGGGWKMLKIYKQSRLSFQVTFT